jgi:hypothetical protein
VEVADVLGEHLQGETEDGPGTAGDGVCVADGVD